MSKLGYVEAAITQQIDGTALTNTVTATSILAGAAKFVLPANFFEIGKWLRIRAAGRISTLVTSPGTLTLDLRLGSVIVFNGGAMTLNVTSQTNATWHAEFDLICRAIGATTVANLFGTGKFSSRAIIGSAAAAAGGTPNTLLPDTAPGVGTGFDSTAAQILDFFAAWSVANAANSIRCDMFNIELMN